MCIEKNEIESNKIMIMESTQTIQSIFITVIQPGNEWKFYRGCSI